MGYPSPVVKNNTDDEGDEERNKVPRARVNEPGNKQVVEQEQENSCRAQVSQGGQQTDNRPD